MLLKIIPKLLAECRKPVGQSADSCSVIIGLVDIFPIVKAEPDTEGKTVAADGRMALAAVKSAVPAEFDGHGNVE
jgi:hypothetical protein